MWPATHEGGFRHRFTDGDNHEANQLAQVDSIAESNGVGGVLSAIPLPLTAATAEVLAPVPAQALAERFQQTPPQFVEDRGQWPDSAVRFALSRRRVNVALTANGPRFQLWRAAGTESKARSRHLVMEPSAVLTPEEPSPQRKEFTAIFLNAHSVVPTGESQSQELFHFRHGEASQWRETCRLGGRDLPQLYDGIALRVSSRSHGINTSSKSRRAPIGGRCACVDGIERLALTDKGALQIKLGDNWALSWMSRRSSIKSSTDTAERGWPIRSGGRPDLRL